MTECEDAFKNNVPLKFLAGSTKIIRTCQSEHQGAWWEFGAEMARRALGDTGWDWTLPTALFLGSEGSGLHRLVKERCDSLLRIPMVGHLSSLNVSVAAGVLCFEALRQRTTVKMVKKESGGPDSTAETAD